MKLIRVFICILFPLFIYSKEDSLLYRKRFNLSLGANISIPQVRYVEGVQTQSYPNGAWFASPSKPIFNSNVTQNGFNFYVNTELKVYKKLYVQSGLGIEILSNKVTSFRDTLYSLNGMVGNTDITIFKAYNIIIPLGIQYRFKNYFFTTFGFTSCIYNISTVSDKIYRNSTLITSSFSSAPSPNFPDIHYYISGSIRMLPRTFLSLRISNTFPSKYNTFKDNLYYSIGIKFYII